MRNDSLKDYHIKNSLLNYEESSEDSDFSRVIMPEHRALAYTKKEEEIMAKKAIKKSENDVKVEETKVSEKAAAEKQQEEPAKENKPGFLDRAKKIGKTIALIGGVVAAVAVGNKIGQAKGYREGVRDREEFGNVPALPEPPEEDIVEDEVPSDDV